MKSKVLLVFAISTAISLLAGCCGLIPPQGAVSFAKTELAALARQRDVEITEIQVEDYYEGDVSPADRANGIQAYASFDLRYACRCSWAENWSNCVSHYALRKVNGTWERNPNLPGLNTDMMPDCTLPTPTPVPWSG